MMWTDVMLDRTLLLLLLLLLLHRTDGEGS